MATKKQMAALAKAKKTPAAKAVKENMKAKAKGGGKSK